jgi:hypothetical protein
MMNWGIEEENNDPFFNNDGPMGVPSDVFGNDPIGVGYNDDYQLGGPVSPRGANPADEPPIPVAASSNNGAQEEGKKDDSFMIDTSVKKKNYNNEWISAAYIDSVENFECDEQDLVDKLDFHYPLNSVNLKPLNLDDGDGIPDNSEANTDIRHRL